jgi:hypothetical protein
VPARCYVTVRTCLTADRSYTQTQQLASFYTGGRPVLSRDGTRLVTPCGEAVSVVDLTTGAVVHTLAGVRPACARAPCPMAWATASGY